MDRLNERLSNLKQGVENMTEPEIKVSKLFLESVCEYLQKLKDYKDLEEQGSCKRCTDKGKWNRSWMPFLYKIEGYEGCYCAECVEEIKAGVENE